MIYAMNFFNIRIQLSSNTFFFRHMIKVEKVNYVSIKFGAGILLVCDEIFVRFIAV